MLNPLACQSASAATCMFFTSFIVAVAYWRRCSHLSRVVTSQSESLDFRVFDSFATWLTC